MTEKMDGTSLDISAENRARLKALFPTVFTETVNNKGELVESVDFEKLKAELGTFTDLFESRRERYGMDWPGKKEALRLIQTPSAATLKPCREESVNFDTTENLFIEGDNLEVLKLLQKSYYGKVKMIDIDPPYNTGKEFIYPDNYSESLETYLEYAGLIDGEGKKFSTNTPNEGRFHTKWLNMMYPRLYLARNLLRDDGVIFIHIDDNEVSNLRKMCDEIFGEENFVGNIAWKKTSGDNKPVFAFTHDNILIFTKNIGRYPRVGLNEEQKKQYKNPDNDPRGDWAESDYRCKWSKLERPNLYYGIENPFTKEIIYPDTHSDSTRVWGCEPNTHKQNVLDGLVWWGVDGKSKEPKKKRFLSEHGGTNTRSIWLEAGSNDEAGKEVRELLNGDYFDNPKPVKLLITICKILTSNSDIILDFFSGSSTTAHAVLDLNKDGGNRKFIMVQLPEPCAEDSEAFKAGYKTIADIGKERIRRVIRRLTPGPSPEGEGRQNGEENDLFRGAAPSLFANANKLRKNKTEAEEKLWQAIRNRNINNCKFRRQHPIGQFIAVFYCHEFNLIVEVDGGYHNEEEQKLYDAARTQIINEFGVRVIRFTNEEISGDLPDVLTKISIALADASPLSSRRGAGGEAGFRVLKLDKSNFKQWQKLTPDAKSEEIEKQLFDHIDHIDHKATPEDLLFEILIKAGFMPTEKVQTIKLAGIPVFSIADGGLLICLADIVTKELINAVAEAEPMQFICLDKAFGGNDQLKANAVQTFNARNMGREKANQIVFRTV